MKVVVGEKTVVARWTMTKEQEISNLSDMSALGHHAMGEVASWSSRTAKLYLVCRVLSLMRTGCSWSGRDQLREDSGCVRRFSANMRTPSLAEAG